MREQIQVLKNGRSLCQTTSWTYMYMKVVDKEKGFTALQEQEVSSCLRASVSPQTCTSHFTLTSKSTKIKALFTQLNSNTIKQVLWCMYICMFVECSGRRKKLMGSLKRGYGPLNIIVGHWKVKRAENHWFRRRSETIGWDSNMMKCPRHNENMMRTRRQTEII